MKTNGVEIIVNRDLFESAYEISMLGACAMLPLDNLCHV
jgi:hypothetical protein